MIEVRERISYLGEVRELCEQDFVVLGEDWELCERDFVVLGEVWELCQRDSSLWARCGSCGRAPDV